MQRKSLYAQLQGQLQQLSEAIKDKEGTIETLERQLVQAGIKGKVMQGAMEVDKRVNQVKAALDKERNDAESQASHLKDSAKRELENKKRELTLETDYMMKDLALNIKNTKNNLQESVDE